MTTSFSYTTLDSKNLWNVNSGLWGELPNRAPDQNGKLINGANASLLYNGNFIGLWINDISVDFSLSGTTGQGPFNQDFYPHNLISPALTVTGQTTNVGQKNRLADFIRYTHSNIVKTTSTKPSDLITLTLHTNGQKNARTQKGSPSPFKVYGFINTVPFGATKFTTAYTYQFSFSISYTSSNASSSNQFLGLNFSPTSVAQLTSITQWATDPTNKSLFVKPGDDKAVNQTTNPKKVTSSSSSSNNTINALFPAGFKTSPAFTFNANGSPLLKVIGSN